MAKSLVANPPVASEMMGARVMATVDRPVLVIVTDCFWRVPVCTLPKLIVGGEACSIPSAGMFTTLHASAAASASIRGSAGQRLTSFFIKPSKRSLFGKPAFGLRAGPEQIVCSDCGNRIKVSLGHMLI